MNRLAILAIFTAFLVAPGLAQSQSSNSGVDPGFLPGTPMHSFETAIERAEVRLAGLIGGPDMKAKAIANNAQERLAEANALAERNRSEDVSEAVEKYEEAMNRSQQISDRSNNSELSDQIRNVSRNNVEQLEQVRKRVPEQAREGIDRAIRNSKNNGRPDLSNENDGNPLERPEASRRNQSRDSRDKGPDLKERRPNQSLEDLENSENGSKLNDTVPGTDLGQGNSNRESRSTADLEEGIDSGLKEENGNSDQPDSNEESENENLPDGVGNQPP